MALGPVLKQGLARLYWSCPINPNPADIGLSLRQAIFVTVIHQSQQIMTTQLEIPEKALQIKETKPFTALCFTTRTSLSTLSQYVFTVAEDLYREANRLGLEVSGPIQWIYTGVNGDETNEFSLDIVLPISQPGSQSDRFRYQIFPSFRCACYTFTGPWSEFGMLYDLLFSQLYRDGYQNDGYVREVYTVIDLENPALCVTEIQIKVL